MEVITSTRNHVDALIPQIAGLIKDDMIESITPDMKNEIRTEN